LEHIDYSICTLEFETRRESYYWVLEALDLYRPKVRRERERERDRQTERERVRESD
jgi:glutamyl/glutaminyl-tRNA synthetase